MLLVSRRADKRIIYLLTMVSLYHTRPHLAWLLARFLACGFLLPAGYTHAASQPGNDLLAAAERGDVQKVDQLLQDPNTDRNPMDEDGRTALFRACIKSRTEVVKRLLEDGKVNVNQPDNSGKTPLMKACEAHDTEIVRLLLAHPKIDLNAQEKEDGLTALYLALGSIKTVKLLLQHKKLEVNKQFNKVGWTALDMVYFMMAYDPIKGDRADEYSTLWDMLVKRGGKCSYFKQKRGENPLKLVPQFLPER